MLQYLLKSIEAITFNQKSKYIYRSGYELRLSNPGLMKLEITEVQSITNLDRLIS